MTAGGWSNLILLAAPFASVYASSFPATLTGSFVTLLAVFLIFSTLSSFIMRRFATAEEKRAQLEDAVRNPPA